MKAFLSTSLLIILSITGYGQSGMGFPASGVANSACANPADISGVFTTGISATVQLSDATAGGTWSSTNTAVATIGTAGLVSGISAGTTIISYSVTGGCFSLAQLTVSVSAVTYASWSPTNRAGTCSLSNANLTMRTNTSGGAGAFGVCIATIGKSAGKYYWEYRIDQKTASSEQCGIVNYIPTNLDATVCGQSAKGVGFRGGPWCVSYYFTSFIQQGACIAPSVADIIAIAADFTAGTVAVYKNNVLQSTVTSLPAGTWYPACNATNVLNDGITARFDPATFTYTAPSGYGPVF